MIDIFTPWVSLAQMTKLVSELLLAESSLWCLGVPDKQILRSPTPELCPKTFGAPFAQKDTSNFYRELLDSAL